MKFPRVPHASRGYLFITAGAAVAAVLLAGAQERPRASAVPLGVDGSYFTINGRPQFLFIVSMFDALREAHRGTGPGSALDRDFAYLKTVVRADGIRVMPNWWKDGDGRTPRFSLDSLFDPDRRSGQWARPGRLQPMHDLLTAAARHGLVVDVTFTRETMRTGSGAFMPEGEYQRSVISAINDLAPHDNAMFDAQNEYSCAHLNGVPNMPVLSDGTVARIRQGVSASCILTASPCSDPSGVGQTTHDLNLSSAAYHNRGSGWATDRAIGSEINTMRSKTTAPIYYQEPQKFDDDPNAAEFSGAAKAARLRGAAAWTFHTAAGYRLEGPDVTFRARLASARVSPALERIRAAIESACQLTVSPAHITQSGIVHVDVLRGCVWAVAASDASIQAWPASGSGPADVRVTLTAPDFAARRGTITIGGRTVTVTRNAR